VSSFLIPEYDTNAYNSHSHDAALSTTTEEVVKLIRDNDDYYWFAGTMQGDFPNSFIGVHAGGHFTIGGDPQGVCAPLDFALHHP
jgi:tyrosinase